MIYIKTLRSWVKREAYIIDIVSYFSLGEGGKD